MTRLAPNKAGFTRVVSWLCLAAVWAGTGCQSQRLAQSRLDRRAGNLRWTADRLADREQRNADWIHRDLQYIRDRLQLDAVRTERNFVELDRWIQRDVDRWIDRQPVYRREIERILRGKPERIEPTAVWLFF